MSDLKLCCVRSQLLAGYKQCNIEIILLPDWVALYNGTPLTLSIDPCTVLDWLHVRKVFIVRVGIVIQNQPSWVSAQRIGDKFGTQKLKATSVHCCSSAFFAGMICDHTLEFANRWMRPKARPYMGWWPRYGVGEDDQGPPINNCIFINQQHRQHQISTEELCERQKSWIGIVVGWCRSSTAVKIVESTSWDEIAYPSNKSSRWNWEFDLFRFNVVITYCGRERGRRPAEAEFAQQMKQSAKPGLNLKKAT